MENSIVVIVYGLYREVDDSNKNKAIRLRSRFRELRLSLELFKGSFVYRIAKAMLL